MMKGNCRNNCLSWALAIAVSLMAEPAMAQDEATQPSLAAGPVDASVQQPPSQGDQIKDEPDARDEQAEQPGEHKRGTSDDRLFWTLPNFLTVENGHNLPPLATRQKFDVTTRSGFDESEYGWYAVLAEISQAENAEPSYGGGLTSYAKRYGLAFADGAIENYMVNAIYPSMLHQDPRYYRMGKGSVWRRAGYSVSRIFVSRSDAGRSQFNFSEILGSATAAGLYNAYHPASDRTVGYTLSSWGSQVTYDTISIVLKEFWPDIRRKFSRGSA
jgi:hypothetical protein